jgi:hypothetical protein
MVSVLQAYFLGGFDSRLRFLVQKGVKFGCFRGNHAYKRSEVGEKGDDLPDVDRHERRSNALIEWAQ